MMASTMLFLGKSNNLFEVNLALQSCVCYFKPLLFENSTFLFEKKTYSKISTDSDKTQIRIYRVIQLETNFEETLKMSDVNLAKAFDMAAHKTS